MPYYKNPTTGEGEELPGGSGTSVTVKNVFESTASGGTNVIEFSDGNKVNIKNGINGKDGTNGKDGEKGEKGDPYTLTETDKNTIAQAVYAMVADGNEVAY